MLNWLTKGYFDIAKYTGPVILLIAVIVWFCLIMKNTDIKKNKKALIKIGICALVLATVAPFVSLTLTGKLFNFLAGFGNIFKSAQNFFGTLKTVFCKGFSITSGLMFLAVLIVFVVKDAKKMTFAILYPFPLFAAIARVNCFLKGCCFGVRTNISLLSVTYPPGSQASKFHFAKFNRESRFLESLPVHPTQLYIAAAMLLLYAAVILMNRFGVRKNIIAGTVLSGYGFANFLIEFLREEPLLFNFLTLGQFMDFVIIGIGIYLIFSVKEEEIFESK
ncbi:prolipoprotein diacylglyceryl transferase [bacterium]|nr:prolipoprotein diacylglyceryl transferase [bacterium]